LYPAEWRARYSAEFEALLEDAELCWGDLWDVFRGAVAMRIETWSFGKISALCGLVGVLLAVAVAFAMPNWYVSTAVLKNGGEQPASSAAMTSAAREAFSRSFLAELIEQANLYPELRHRVPLDDVVEVMRRDIQIENMSATGLAPSAFAVRFLYRDAAQAQSVVRAISTKFVETRNLEVLEPANLDGAPAGPNRTVIAGLGLAGGFLAGGMVALVLRMRRRAA